VFVDESGANTKMTRLGGRAPVGERLVTHNAGAFAGVVDEPVAVTVNGQTFPQCVCFLDY
jgi:hypothetical protein